MAFQILSLSGGGYLGLYTATVLAGIERQTGRPLIKSFDMVAGTSIGGIIALGLAAGRDAGSIATAIEEAGPGIFGHRSSSGNSLTTALRIGSGMRSPLYSPDPLRQAIEEIVGRSTRIADLLGQPSSPPSICRKAVPRSSRRVITTA